MMQKAMIGCAAALAAAGAFAAVEPLVRWSGDFAETSVKSGYTLKANGNVVAADGSSITISESATAGVTIDYPSSVRVTVAVRYADMTAPASQAVLISSAINTSSDRSGAIIDPMWHVSPIFDGVPWVNTSSPDKSAPVAFPAGSEGCLAYCYYPGLSLGGLFFATDWSGAWVKYREWANQAGADTSKLTGCAIGGPRGAASSKLALLKGLVIKEIAVYNGQLTAADLDAAFPCERRQPTPLLRFSADAGIETDGNGNVTKWRNQGALPGEDVVPHGNGGKASAKAITLAQSAAMGGPVVRFDKTDFLVAQGANQLGFTDFDKHLFAVWVSDTFMTSEAEVHGFFGVYPEVATQEGQYPLSSGTLTYKTLDFSYDHRVKAQLGCVKADESDRNAHALHFGMSKSGRRLLSAVTTDSLSYGYNAAGHDVSYGLESGGTLAPFSVGKLRIGHSGFYSTDLMRGDIAEIRLYNQPFTAAMRFAVECELAAKYGFDLLPTASADTSDLIGSKTLAGCGNDPAAFGDVPSGGVPVTQVPVSATSGGLAVAFAGTPAADASTLVYVGNNGLTGAEKVWCVVGAEDAKALPLTLTFDASTLAALETPTLYTQAGKDDSWVRFSAPVTVTDAGLTVTLPGGWENARYRLMDVSTAVVPAVWFRADKGVTQDGSGNVIRWENQGTMGSVLDLGPAEGNPGVTVVQNEQFGTSLHFDAAHYLKQIANEQTTLGIEKNVGGSCFVVLDLPDADTYRNQMVYGLYPDQETEDAWVAANWENSFVFGLCFAYNMCMFQHNFFGYRDSAATFFRKTDRKPGKHILSVTAASDFVFGRGTTACVDGLVVSNGWSLTSGKPTVVNEWAGNVHPGYLTVGYYAFASAGYTILCGDIAELRVYSHPLSMTEQAAVELELAAKYGFSAKTVGEVDAAAVAAHAVNARVIGAEAFRGPHVTDMETEWTDGALGFAFKENPPLPPETVAEGAGVKSLAYLASDGGENVFVPRPGSASVQDLSRTWYVASACPTYGGVMELSCDTTDASEWKYCLSRKANGASAFVRLPDIPVVGDGKVTFSFDELTAGTYRLERRPADVGFLLILR